MPKVVPQLPKAVSHQPEATSRVLEATADHTMFDLLIINNEQPVPASQHS